MISPCWSEYLVTIATLSTIHYRYIKCPNIDPNQKSKEYLASGLMRGSKWYPIFQNRPKTGKVRADLLILLV